MSGRNFGYSFTKAIGRMIVTPKRRVLVLKDELLIENKCLIDQVATDSFGEYKFLNNIGRCHINTVKYSLLGLVLS